MKKISFLVLSFFLFSSILTLSSCLSFSNGGLLFTEVEGGYQVTGVSLKDRFYKNFTVEIPSEYNGKPVVAISDYAFSGYSSLVKITIPETVTRIGDFAFFGCMLLQEIELPKSLTHIGNYVFNGVMFENIFIPENVEYIGDSAFVACYELINIEVDENNPYFKSIDGNLYSKDEKIFLRYAPGKYDAVFAVPNVVEHINSHAFLGCEWITSIGPIGSEAALEIPDSVITIGDFAFSGVAELTSVVIPNSVITIGSCAFNGNENLQSVVIGDSVELIGSAAFQQCSSLTSVTMGDSVTTIGVRAFSQCPVLTNFEMSGSILSIGYDAFYECTSLKYNEYNGALYLGNENNPYVALMDLQNRNITSADIHNETRFISCYAFSECKQLKTVVIPDSVRSIGFNAFKKCESLTDVTIPDSLIYIDDQAFWRCSSLKDIRLPDSLIHLGDDAFALCGSLEFAEYRNGYYLGNENNPYMVLVDTKTDNITSFEIHNETRFIHSSALDSCSKLMSVTIPDSVTMIGDDSFMYCSKLSSISIPKFVTYIGEWTFYGCNSLNSIYFDGTVEEWNAVEKGKEWNNFVPATEVICSDGRVPLK